MIDAKVIFFTGVCDSVNRGGEGVCSRGGVGSGPRGVSGPGGVSAPRGSALGESGPRGCLLPGTLVETPGTATAAGGTHPTGMHSCTKENNLSV